MLRKVLIYTLNHLLNVKIKFSGFCTEVGTFLYSTSLTLSAFTHLHNLF